MIKNWKIIQYFADQLAKNVYFIWFLFPEQIIQTLHWNLLGNDFEEDVRIFYKQMQFK